MKKRILVVPFHFTLGKGSGSESATAVKIIRDLATAFDLDVMTGNLQGSSPFQKHVTVHELYPGPVPVWTHLRRLRFLWDVAVLSRKIVQEKRIDVLFHCFPFDHHHGSFLPLLVPNIPLIIGPLTLPIDLLRFPDEAGGVGRVLLARAGLPLTGLLSAVAIHHGRAVVCESEASCEYWSGIGENDRMGVIHNALETQFSSIKRGAQDLGAHPKSWCTLITVGNLFRRKGVDRCIEVVSHLVPRFPFPIRLLIVGDGPQRSQLEQQVQQVPGERQPKARRGPIVRFLGRVPKEKMPALYRQADLALILPRTEAFANTAMEAMATGIPVVATDVGAMREIVDDAKTGFLVPSDHLRLMVDRTAELVGDVELRKKMGREAARIVRKKFDAGRIKKQWISVVNQVIK